jgi:hypothetical protein
MVKVWMLSSHPVATAWLASVVATLVHHGASVDYDDVPYLIVTPLSVHELVRILRRWVHRSYLRRNNIAVTWHVVGDEVHMTISEVTDA